MQIQYQAPDFNFDQIDSCVAMVRGCGDEEVIVAIFDPMEQELKYYSTWKEFEKMTASTFESLNLLKLYVIRENFDVAYYPDAVFEEKNRPIYEQYLAKDGTVGAVCQDLPLIGVKALEIPDFSGLPKQLVSLIGTTNDGIQVLSDSSILLEGMGSYLYEDENNTIGFHVEGNRVFAYYFNQGNFVYANQYSALFGEQVESTLVAFETAIGVDIKSCRCLVSGMIDGSENAVNQAIRRRCPSAQFVDLAEVTGDALVPGELMPFQQQLILFYLGLHTRTLFSRSTEKR